MPDEPKPKPQLRKDRAKNPIDPATNKPKKGRPHVQIDWKLFENLCHIHCTTSEIASCLRIGNGTLYERTEKQYGQPFQEIYKRYQEGGKASLRRTQMRLAQKNASMCIWLGKQYLGQQDHQRESNDQVHQFVSDLKLIVNNQMQASGNGLDVKVS